MQMVEITSFDDGIIRWAAQGAHAFSVEVDGEYVSDGGDGLYRACALDVNRFEKKPLVVSVCDARDERSRVDFVVSSDRKTLSMPTVPVEVKSGVLHWRAVPGASRYKLVDIKQNVIYTDRCYYDANYRNVVYGVCAVSANKLIRDGEIAHIKYLDGSGSEESPFIICSPFELRAIDYYEQLYADGARARNHYIIDRDINFNSVAALEGESNMFTLSRPFYGVLDGGRHMLYNVTVGYDGGYWALFDFLARGAVIENLIFSGMAVTNRLQSAYAPLDASIAAVAHVNYGEIRNIVVKNAKFLSGGGAVCGICSHNSGTVRDCTVSGEFAQSLSGLIGQACYEAAGIVAENRAGGVVENNAVLDLTIRGSFAEDARGVHYPNVRTAAGIVAVNRAGGCVSDNMFGRLNFVSVEPQSAEYGGVCAYNAGLVRLGDVKNTGAFKVNGAEVKRAVGKNDGVVVGEQCTQD